MGFSRLEYWSGSPFPFPGDLPNPGIEPRSPALEEDSLPAEPQGKLKKTGMSCLSLLQGIFLTQESNWGLLHCRWILYQLNYQGSSTDLGSLTTVALKPRLYLNNPILDFPHSLVSKDSACNAEDLCLTPGSGRSPGEGNGKALQWSCLGNLMDRGAWQATVHGVELDTT